MCSFLFGPAAAWGAAIGNLIGDFFGGLGPGDLFGFTGNFLYGLRPVSRCGGRCGTGDPVPRTLAGMGAASWSWSSTAASLLRATVGWGLQILGFVPFAVLANVVIVNNLVMALVLGAVAARGALSARPAGASALWRRPRAAPAASRRARAGSAWRWSSSGALGAFVGGNLAAAADGCRGAPPTAAARLALGFGVLPGLATAVVGLALL